MYCGRLVSATVWYQVSAARLIAVIFMMACPDNVLEGDEEGCGGHRQTTGLLGHTAKHCQVRTSPIETPPPADTTHRPTDRWTVPLYVLPATTKNIKTSRFLNQIQVRAKTFSLLMSMDVNFAINILRDVISCSFSTMKMETAFSPL